MIRVGPAGWSYADWKGAVYPIQAKGRFDHLGFLARFYDTIEINTTFYRPAARKSAEQWCERVASNPHFRFTMKLWSRFTHDRASPWTESELDEATLAARTLSSHGRLGAVLAQFPWSFRRDARNRAWLERLTGELADLPLAIEIRHASWDTPAFFESLAERGVAFVNIDQPRHAGGIGPSSHATARTGYVRVHGRNEENWFRPDAGVNERYDYFYSADELKEWATRVRTIAERADEVYVITNNHFEGQAAANASMLDSMLRGQKVPAPAPLFDRYGEALAAFATPSSGERASDA